MTAKAAVEPAGVGPSQPPPNKAQWLAQAQPVAALLAKGDIASVRLIEQLLVDAVPLVTAGP